MSIPEKREHCLADRWDTEYREKGIPSSFRSVPSGSVEEALRILLARGFGGRNAVDIGCGTGRNSTYLASRGFTVCSIDFVPRMIAELQKMSQISGTGGRIFPFCQNVTSRWPVADKWCDLAVDMFCFKHLVSAKDRDAYKHELIRSLSATGYYVLTLAGLDDEYYGPLPRQSSDIGMEVVLDPKNGIPSALYSREDVENLFGPEFLIDHYEHKSKYGLMHDGEYHRSTHFFVMRKTVSI